MYDLEDYMDPGAELPPEEPAGMSTEAKIGLGAAALALLALVASTRRKTRR